MPNPRADADRTAVPPDNPAPWWQALAARAGRSVGARYVTRFLQTDMPALAASLSFFTLLSLAPLVITLLWFTTLLYPAAQEEFFAQIGLLAGPEVESTARLIVANAERRKAEGTFGPVLGAATLLIGASIVFGQLQVALNRVFGEQGERLTGLMVWLRKRLLSFGMVASLGFLLVVSMVVQTGLQLMFAYVPGIWPVVATLVSFLLYTGGFAAMYHWLPDTRVGWRRAIHGGLLTASLFLVGRWAIGLYLGQAALGTAYGPAGGLVVMLFWLYYSALVILGGALATAMLDEFLAARRRLRERHQARAGGDTARDADRAPGGG